ncbi:MAG: SDR family oxidoreductase [Poseidonia sp.]
MPQALVTGANRGIGLELTRQLLESGYSVHATYRKTEGGLTELVHPLLHLHQLDVRSDEAIAAVASVIDGGLDLLINNAGIADGRWASVEDIDFEVVSEVIEVNAIAPIRVTRGLLPALERAGGGTVVMMTSLMASIADCHSGRSYAYRASKTALNMLTVAMKNELLDRNISLMLLHPGWVETDMGGPNAPLQPKESVEGILNRIHEQTLEMSGRFVQYDGAHLPW